MASIIIFSNLWGLGLHEWRGASGRAMRLLFFSIFLLVASTVIVGYGNYLGTKTPVTTHAALSADVAGRRGHPRR